MGRLQEIIVDTKGVRTQMNFEMIEIVDDINPHPALLGIDWVTEMNDVINLKKQKMIFEKKSVSVVVPLDPGEGVCYIEPVHYNGSNGNLKYQIS